MAPITGFSIIPSESGSIKRSLLKRRMNSVNDGSFEIMGLLCKVIRTSSALRFISP